MAVKYLKVDILKARKMWYMLLLPLLIFVFLAGKNATSGLFGLAYCLFISIVVSTYPANSEIKGERGFLQMLPAKPGADIKGHFLFAAAITFAYAALAVVIIAVSKRINPGLQVFEIGGVNVGGLYLAVIGVALLFSAVEVTILSVFRYKSVQVQQLMRIVPAFIFFFAMSRISDLAEEVRLPNLSFEFGTGSILVFLCCIVIFTVLMEVSARVSARQN